MRLVIFITVMAIVGAGAYYLIGVTRPTKPSPIVATNTVFESIRLKTKDGIEIAGDYYPATGSRGVLLLHMMPSDRKSWLVFAVKLQTSGFRVLAIDLRGHGESQGGPGGYKDYSDAEHQVSRFDVEAAIDFLKSKGVEELNLVGASIGANLSLDYAANHPEIKSLVLLSPGLDYRGIKTEPAILQLSDRQGIFLVASEDDKYSLDTVNKLAAQIVLGDKRQVKIFSQSGHGTAILENNPEFMSDIIEWLNRQ